MGNKIPLAVFRDHYARMAAVHRANEDRANSKGLYRIARLDAEAAKWAQDRANAITIALRVQHMGAAS